MQLIPKEGIKHTSPEILTKTKVRIRVQIFSSFAKIYYGGTHLKYLVASSIH